MAYYNEKSFIIVMTKKAYLRWKMPLCSSIFFPKFSSGPGKNYLHHLYKWEASLFIFNFKSNSNKEAH